MNAKKPSVKAQHKLISISLIFSLLLLLNFLSGTQSVFAGTTPTISTDQTDYQPGSTVTLTGAGWAAGEAVHIFVNDDAGQTWSYSSSPDPVADGAGNFTYQFQLPVWFVANYSVTATGPISGVATASFTDVSIGTYDQCSNDLGEGYPTTSTDPGCQWINGNLNSNNSRYVEGDATVQRLWLTDLLPGSTHTMTFQYGTTKGGRHAYDFLTTWDWSENWITLPDRCQGISGCTTNGETYFDIPQDPRVPDSFEPSAPGDRQFVMRGGTITAATTPALASGTYGTDSETSITITFTVDSTGPMCSTTCGVAVWFGAHVAVTSDWMPVDGGGGAGTIPGSPYHVALKALDGTAVGKRDNQMQSGTIIPNGTIVIIKDAIPNDPQDFTFTLVNSTITHNFSLDDDSDLTLPNQQSFSLPPGTWTATETSIPADWQLTGLACVDPTNNTVVNLASATATIDLASNETVTCTFTDTKGHDLTVSKTATAAFHRAYAWSIAKNVDKTKVYIAEGGTATFNYTVGVSHDSGTDSAWTVSGTITVSNSNSYAISGVNITDAIDHGGTCNVTGGSNVTVPASGTAQASYTCTFTSAPGAGTNTATATWNAATYHTPTGSAQGTAGYDFSTVTPTVSNGTITVVDDKTNPGSPVVLGTATYTQSNPINFTYSLNKSGVAGTSTSYTNTATIQGTTQSATQTVTVYVGKDLTVTKTAAGTFDRTYLWKISKDVDQTLVKIAAGGSYAFKYSVVAEQTGFSDASWTLSGKITLTNPNDWEDITLTSLADAVDNGGVCTVAAGPYKVLASGSLDVNYSCSYASAPTSYSGTNTATANWDKALAFTPTGSASGSKTFTQTQLGSTNKTIHVTDSFGGALGTVTATDGTPFAKGTFTYDRTVSGVAGDCTTYDNTATITETGQSASKSVQLCVAKDLTVTKTANATAGRIYKWLIDKSVDDTRIEIAAGDKAIFNYSVTVTPNGFTDDTWAMSGQITVSNPNDWEDITANVTDVYSGGGTCAVTGGTGVVVLAGGSKTLDYSCTFTSQPAYSGTNTATASWNPALFFTPSGSASGTAPVTFNVGGETNKVITVKDDKTDPANPVTLGTWNWADGPHTFTYSLEKVGVPGTCVDYTNTAVIDETKQSDSQKVTVCVGKDLTVSKTAAGTFDRVYQWDIVKDVDKTSVNIALGGTATFNYSVTVSQTGVEDAGWTLSGKITLANPNDWEAITLTSLTDAVDNGGVCTVDPGPYTVAKSGSLDVNYSCTYASKPSSYSGTNTATASWDKAAAFTPTGLASGTAGFTLTQAGSTNKTVTVTDTLGGNLGTVTANDAPAWATKTFTYSMDFQGVGGTCTKYDNTATITETKQSDSEQVTVCVGIDLTVSKTAAGAFNRAYPWQITKDVDKTTVDIDGNNLATFNYTVVVSQTGLIDSAWSLSGKITLTNPNDWEDITLISLADMVDNGPACVLIEAAPYTVAKSGTLEVNYSCTYASQPATYSGTNTATATWDKAAAFTPTGSASGTAAFTLAQAGSINKTVTVTDTLGGPLGTVTANDAPAWATKTFTYSKDFPGVGGACTTYDNTATIIETKQIASKAVTVCRANLVVTKTVKWNNITPVPSKTFEICVQGPSFPGTPNCQTIGYQGGDLFWNDVLPGQYTITETFPGKYWKVTITGSPVTVPQGGTGHGYVENDNQDPTAITLLYFKAERQPDKSVIVKWETAAEQDNAGFLIYRTNGKSFNTDNLLGFVRSKGHGTYQMTDTPPGNGRWFYWLVDVDTHDIKNYEGAAWTEIVIGDAYIYIPTVRH